MSVSIVENIQRAEISQRCSINQWRTVAGTKLYFTLMFIGKTGKGRQFSTLMKRFISSYSVLQVASSTVSFFFFSKTTMKQSYVGFPIKRKKKKEKLRVLGYLPCAAFWLSFHTWLSVKGDGVRHGHCRMEGQTPGQFSCKHLTTVKRTKKQNKVNVVSWLHLLIKDKGTSEVFLATVYYFDNLSVSFTTDHTFQDLVMCTKL